MVWIKITTSKVGNYWGFWWIWLDSKKV